MTPRGQLLWQLGILSSIILLVIGLVDLTGPFPLAFVPQAIASGLFAVSAVLARRHREELGSTLLLATAMIAILLFDDGFQGSVHSWVLYIPLWIVALVLHPPEHFDRALLWTTMLVGCVVLVNATDLTPRWNARLNPTGSTFLAWEAFLVAAIGTGICVRFLQRSHDRLLKESRKLSADLQDALTRAESASRAKSDFLSHMSHELRTPLNAISGFAQLLQQEPSSITEASENVQAIRISAEHLVHLVGDVLDLSRLEHGNLVLSRTPFHPVDQIRVVHSILIQSAREKGLALELDLDPNLGWIEGDPVRWRQVLLNLGSNAIKYTDSGSVRIRVTWNRVSDEDGVLETSVQDTGPGIPPEHQAAIFQKFERLPEHEAGPMAGAGLGLSIARDLAEAMSGSLGLDSELGRGSVFHFDIPSRRTDPPQMPSSDVWTLPWNPKGVRILLCEDNRLNIRLARQVLDRLGVEYDVAHDGQEALDQLEDGRFDLILLDLHMPRRTGFDVARALRTSVPPHRHALTPILALTADASEETLRKTREVGMNDYLAKPFHLPELEERLRRLVRRPSPVRPIGVAG